MSKKKTNINRRDFIKSGAVALTSLGVVGAGAGYLKYAKGVNPQKVNFLRPPGAINSNEFIFGCIKCGLCVQICPINAIKLADIDQGFSYGTPYIDVREQACDFSCDSLQCVETCPTAVLDFKQFKNAGEKAITEYQEDHDVTEKDYNPFDVQIQAMREQVSMGKAKVIEGTCLAVQGEGFKGTPRGKDFEGINRTPGTGANKASPIREKTYDREICDLCVTECPIGDKAIVLEEKPGSAGRKSYRPKVLDGCTGCGVCTMVCPTKQSSIVIEPVNA